ncbi:hypothetical protein ES703_68625 [subsurface metagenome]
MKFIYISKGDQQICGGVVYQGTPPELYNNPYLDSQGDWTKMTTLQKSSREWMSGNRLFDVNHEGREYQFPVRESMVIDEDNVIKFGGQRIKKGAWIMVIKVTDPGIWQKIREGAIEGFSIGGSAYAGG